MREHIITEIRRVAGELGRPPGAWAFETHTGIRERHWRGRYWPRWSDALRDAGLQPNPPDRRADPDTVLAELADVVRRFGRMPSLDELKIHRQTFPAPSPNALWRAFGPVPAVVEHLLAWAEGRPDYADVAQLLRREPPGAGPAPTG